MNKIFKVIWNRNTQSLVVTSELSKANVKSSSERLLLQKAKLLKNYSTLLFYYWVYFKLEETLMR